MYNQAFANRQGPLLRNGVALPDDTVISKGDRLRLLHPAGTLGVRTTSVRSADRITGVVVAQRGMGEKIWLEKTIEFSLLQVICILNGNHCGRCDKPLNHNSN